MSDNEDQLVEKYFNMLKFTGKLLLGNHQTDIFFYKVNNGIYTYEYYDKDDETDIAMLPNEIKVDDLKVHIKKYVSCGFTNNEVLDSKRLYIKNPLDIYMSKFNELGNLSLINKDKRSVHITKKDTNTYVCQLVIGDGLLSRSDPPLADLNAELHFNSDGKDPNNTLSEKEIVNLKIDLESYIDNGFYDPNVLLDIYLKLFHSKGKLVLDGNGCLVTFKRFDNDSYEYHEYDYDDDEDVAIEPSSKNLKDLKDDITTLISYGYKLDKLSHGNKPYECSSECSSDYSDYE